jgi:hypothetical protein
MSGTQVTTTRLIYAAMASPSLEFVYSWLRVPRAWIQLATSGTQAGSRFHGLEEARMAHKY